MSAPGIGRGVASTLVAVACLVLFAAGAGAAAEASATVSIHVTGAGIVRSDEPGRIDCGSTCTAAVAPGAEVVLEASPSPRNQFTRWEGACSGAARLCELTVEQQGTLEIEARFDPGFRPTLPTPHRLGIVRSGSGSVSSDPTGIIDCGATCYTEFSGGGTVVLKAAAEGGSRFVGWSGACSGSGDCKTALSSNRDVAATFRPPTVAPGVSRLTVSNHNPFLSPAPVIVTTPGGSVTCQSTCSLFVSNGSMVELAGDMVRNWTGACVGLGGRCLLFMSGPASVSSSVAQFLRADTSYGVNVSRSGRGRVTSKPPGIDCGPSDGCAAAFKPDSKVELTASADDGSRFVRWRGDCESVQGTTCAIEADSIRSATAVFQLIRDEVRVSLAGDGSGTVASDPAGIACGGDCSHTFARGSVVLLRATAADGSRFRGWSGPCAGTGECAWTSQTATAVTARFARICAARDLKNVRVAIRRKPRRVAVSLQLSSRASVRLSLLRGGRARAERTFAGAAAARVLALNIPKTLQSGPARVRVKVHDVCGVSKTLSAAVRIP
jgi:Divergent InlB B-repeat domain